MIKPQVLMVSLWLFFTNTSVVEKDVMDIFVHFHQYSMFEQSMHASFLTLIPKKCNVGNIKKFHPINLVGSVFKLLSKVLG